LETEKFLLSQEINIPVYFTPFTPELEEIYLNIKETTSKDSATSAAQGIFFFNFDCDSIEQIITEYYSKLCLVLFLPVVIS